MLTKLQLGQVAEYTIKIIKKMQNEFIRSIVPRQDITDSFNTHVQEFIKHTVWSTDCRAWYRNNETGRVNAVFPGSSLHYSTSHFIDWEGGVVSGLLGHLQPQKFQAIQVYNANNLVVQVIEEPRYEDYNITYQNRQNP